MHHGLTGIEVPTRYAQLLADPIKLADQTDIIHNANDADFVSTLKVVLQIFADLYTP